jgi:hypothetical protein
MEASQDYDYDDTNNDDILDVVRNQVQYGYDDYDSQANPAEAN